MNEISNSSTEALRKKAAEIVSGRNYHLNDRSAERDWITFLLLEILDWILVPFRWLFERTEGLPDFLRWTIVVGLAVVLALLIGHIVYTLITAIRGKKRNNDPALLSRRRTIDPEELERLAVEAETRADYMTSIRYLFRASVVRLELAQKKVNRPGTTNRELLRRYRDQPKLGSALRQFVDTIDRKWYGDEICSVTDFTACESAHREVCRVIEEATHALGA